MFVFPAPVAVSRRATSSRFDGAKSSASMLLEMSIATTIEIPSCFVSTVSPPVRGPAAPACVVGAREVAGAGALHLDDTGAKIGQLPCAERRGNRMLERNHGDAVERSCHGLVFRFFIRAWPWPAS